jgi:hypothetical protein
MAPSRVALFFISIHPASLASVLHAKIHQPAYALSIRSDCPG